MGFKLGKEDHIQMVDFIEKGLDYKQFNSIDDMKDTSDYLIKTINTILHIQEYKFKQNCKHKHIILERNCFPYGNNIKTCSRCGDFVL